MFDDLFTLSIFAFVFLVAIPAIIFIVMFFAYILPGVIKNNKKQKEKKLLQSTFDLNIPNYISTNKNTASSFDYKEEKDLFDTLWPFLEGISRVKKLLEARIKADSNQLQKYLERRAADKIVLTTKNFNIGASRIDILNRYGIRTVGDLIRYGYHYENFNGIGEKTADKIRFRLQEIKRDISLSTRIKLSYDDRNKVSSELVLDIDKYIGISPLAEESKRLLDYKEKITSLLKELKTYTKKIHYSGYGFKALECFNEIAEIYNNNFANIQEKIVNPYNKAITKSINDAWVDFKNNPIEFNKVLEQLSQHAISSEAEYGLSTELAKRIKSYPLDLTGLKLSLRTYQEWGTKFILKQQKSILGDEMGLGKTVQAIAAIIDLYNKGSTHFMIVCPLSVLTNWCREIYKFSDIRYYKVYGSYKRYVFRKWINNGGIAVTTYETLNSISINSEYNLDLLVVDEAHLIKNPQALRTQNANVVIKKAKRAVFLTGTVLENKVDEMIRLIGMLNKSVSNKINASSYTNSILNFKQTVSEVYFRRKRTDVLSELPEKTEIEDWCDLNDVERQAYRVSVLGRNFNRARRVSWDVDDEHSTKLEKLKSIVELAGQEGRKVLVFSFFLDTIAKIKDAFGYNVYGPITGAVSNEERQRIIDNFDKAPNGSMLVSQINSGGIGLNIQSASVVVICEPQFKPSTENQAISRSYRMGQARNVLVYRLLATDTVDERLHELLYNKQKEFDNYADNSLLADASFKIDDKMFVGIMNKEYERLANESDPKTDDYIDNEVILDESDKEVIEDVPVKPRAINIVDAPIGGVSVTSRIKQVSQPRGGYINPSARQKIHLVDAVPLNEYESVAPGLIGTAVDYLTRYKNGATPEDAFEISLRGSSIVNEYNKASNYILRLDRELSDKCIVAALKLVGYDVAFRSGPLYYKDVTDITPDSQTIQNVREMVNRSLRFFDRYGPIVKDGFTFEGGYTNTISSGDGDYLTEDTLWDFKVSKKEPTSKNTLQLLIYYLMGIHSIHPEFKSIKYLGIYNPRLNIVFRYAISNIPKSVIQEVEKYIIGYK